MRTLGVCIAATAILLTALSLPAEPTRSDEAGASSQPAVPIPPEVSADEVIKRMLMSRAKEAVLPEPADAPATQPAETPAPPAMVKPLPAPPGAMIVNRLGRLVADEESGWKRLHFESERDVLYEPPIRVLPNRMLESMEDILQRSGTPRLLFKVTGEVTQYRGHRYLLIRRMIVKRDMGAL